MRRILIAALVLSFIASPVAATDSSRERKLALAREIFEVSGGSERVNQVLGVLLGSVANSYRSLYEQVAATIEDESARAAFLGRYEQELAAFNASFSFAFSERVNLGELAAESLLPVYADLYTEDELQQLIDFYRSPLGQKLIRSQPERLSRATEAMMTRLAPILEDLMQSTIQHEHERLVALATIE